MTQQRYLDDSYVTSFDAKVLSCEATGDTFSAILEGTYFYPESGGQPADHGFIGDARVLDVQLEGDNVLHTIDKDLEPGEYDAVIDWMRRYDHMQQHTGQHLLTAAFIELFDADTVGFHLGSDISTIDVTKGAVDAKDIRAAEDMCSQWIAAALPVTVEYVSIDEFRELPLRKKALPDHIEGPIRLIRSGDVDVAHCGGTHLRSTAELQLIKITGFERVRDTTRVSFLAGQRAILDYAGKHDLLIKLSETLTCGVEDLQHVITKMQMENKENFGRLRKLSKELSALRAGEDLNEAIQAGNWKILCKRYEDLDPGALKGLAGQLTAREPALLFCGVSSFGDKGAVVLAAGSDFGGDLGAVIQQLLPIIDGRGGGRGNFAQGVGDPDKLDDLIEAAQKQLKELE